METQTSLLEPEKPPPHFIIEFLAGFIARRRYGETPKAEQKRAAERLALEFAERIDRLP